MLSLRPALPCVFSLLVGLLVGGCVGDAPESPRPRGGVTESEAASPPVSTDGFRMEVMDSFSISGQPGVVATGTVASGRVAVSDELCLTQSDGETQAVSVAGLERFRDVIETASAGDNVGVLFAAFDNPDLAKGGTLTAGADCR